MLLAFVDIPQRWEHLTLFPVVASDEPELSYLLLGEAIQNGDVTVKESGSRTPSSLSVRNHGSVPVLILDSEALECVAGHPAADQSLLLGPDTVTDVPLSRGCPGRWNLHGRVGTALPLPDGFSILDRQVGTLAFLGRQFLGLDVLGSPDLYSRLHHRLLRGHLTSALAISDCGQVESPANQDELEALAWAMECAERLATPYRGQGEYCLIRGDVLGGELRHNGNLVHLSLFAKGAQA
jgi:hypothetical protein